MINVCLLLKWKIESHYNDSKQKERGKKIFSNSPASFLLSEARKTPSSDSIAHIQAVLELRELSWSKAEGKSFFLWLYVQQLSLFGNDFDRKFFDKLKVAAKAEKALKAYLHRPRFRALQSFKSCWNGMKVLGFGIQYSALKSQIVRK